MAKLPTKAEVERAILDVISGLNVRANEIFNRTTVQLKLQQDGYRAAEINGGFDSLLQRKWFEPASPPHLKLTPAGFDAL